MLPWETSLADCILPIGVTKCMENKVPGAGLLQDYMLLQVCAGGGKEQLLEAVLLCQPNKILTK